MVFFVVDCMNFVESARGLPVHDKVGENLNIPIKEFRQTYQNTCGALQNSPLLYPYFTLYSYKPCTK